MRKALLGAAYRGSQQEVGEKFGLAAPPPWELHVSRRAREQHDLDESLYGTDGRLIFADLNAVRRLAESLNDARDLVNHPDRAVSPGELNALGLLDETLHLLLARYREQKNDRLMADAFLRLEQRLGDELLNEVLVSFLEEFPPTAVYRGDLTVAEYLEGTTEDGTRHVEVALEELLMLWLTNVNPAAAPFSELFDDTPLRSRTHYLQAMHELREYLAVQPGFSEEGPNLLEVLRAPAVEQPLSPQRQLEYVQESWVEQVADQVPAVLSSLDLLAEENKPQLGPGPGPPVVLDFSDLEPEEGEQPEPEHFSVDRAWMPRVILQAKNAHVWLAQLSERGGLPIDRLDQIPDEELDRLEAQGITALWLIGVWERSLASRDIKRRLGDMDAEASAYSLMDYLIADELGGYEAFDDLQVRAMARGIRLSTDMVPNHVGIDSPLVAEHPEWFITTDTSPFPSYSFDGPDLSSDERVEIYLEDHYWDQSDAAVVFKRVDVSTGEASYVYHGNDGTTMPWNDTAQLDYCSAEVREAVMETILHVARHSPVIRFDAAMVLTRLHFHRLWYPEPGSGGAIPSRSASALSQEEFDRLMPEEFWREVVNRVAEEAPETLLLAEAFWLLEGYFVRSLGMHRVYNSAFMNMFRDELNGDYRQLIRNTISFDPRILERFVNFMSNPDERTAIDQFGTGDKYFGVATMMMTMPGLPMIAHGQIEGLTEKYGMEFIRPRLTETPDQRFMAEHEQRLFPLMRLRRIFAVADRFQLFDLVRPGGRVDENVFVYCNGDSSDDEALSLVVYNNADRRSCGRIFNASPVCRPTEEDARRLVTDHLASALLAGKEGAFYRAVDALTGEQYLLSSVDIEERGLAFDLEPYEVRVLWQIEPLADDPRWPELWLRLAGRPVDDLEEALEELVLASVLDPLVELLGGCRLAALTEEWQKNPGAALEAYEFELAEILDNAVEHGLPGPPADVARPVRRQLAAVLAVREWAVGDDSEIGVAVTAMLNRPTTLPVLLCTAVVAGLFEHAADVAELDLVSALAEVAEVAEVAVDDDTVEIDPPASPSATDRNMWDAFDVQWNLARVFESHGVSWRRSRRMAATVLWLAHGAGAAIEGLANGDMPAVAGLLTEDEGFVSLVDAVEQGGEHWYDRDVMAEQLDWLMASSAVAMAVREDRVAATSAAVSAVRDLRLAMVRSGGSLEGLAGEEEVVDEQVVDEASVEDEVVDGQVVDGAPVEEDPPTSEMPAVDE